MAQGSTRFIERPDVSLVTGLSRMKPGDRYVRPAGIREWCLWLTTRGQCRVCHAKGEFIFRPGEAVLIAPHTPLLYGTINLRKDWLCRWVILNPRIGWRELLGWPEEGPGTMRIKLGEAGVRRSIIQCLEEAQRFASTPSWRSQDFAMNALETALLWCDSQNPLSRRRQTDARVDRTIRAITQDLRRKWTASTMARAAGVSAPHLVRLFRRQMGVAPLQFLEQQRLERARQLLQYRHQRIAEIADELGFDNPFYFSLRFKKHTGINPRSYRQESQSAK